MLRRKRKTIAREESPLSKEEVRSVKGYSRIVGEDGNTRLSNLIGVVMEAGGGNPVQVMKEVKSQIGLLRAEAGKVKTLPLR
jgi:hypothetical protein